MPGAPATPRSAPRDDAADARLPRYGDLTFSGRTPMPTA